jgi:solute:Na+ symporter, SSS family
MPSGFTLLDAIVLVVYLAGTTWLGVRLGRGQQDARDYFVGGGRLPWWAICFSVVATETSALTFISIPALAYGGDLGFLQIAMGYLVGRIIVAYVLLPRYIEGKLVTAYTLLGTRFGDRTRRFASLTFMGTRALGDSVRVFATSIPLALILGAWLPAGWGTPMAIIILGACTVLYTWYGGMRAVVWTDVIQMTVYLIGGLSAVVILGTAVTGGWGAIWQAAASADKTRLIDLSLVLSKPHTLWAGLIGGAFLSMASHGADQMIVQRLLGAGSLAEARRALIVSGVVVIAQFTLFLVIGLGLWHFYEGRTFAQPDRIFPEFIITMLPPGLTGLVVAALLAAAMSTISSSLNALAASTTHDLWLPLARSRPSEALILTMARRFTLAWAVVLVGGALLYRTEGTPVVVIALSVASFTYGALLGGFSLGLLWPRARQRDAIGGMSIGLVAMAVVVFARPLSGWSPALAAPLAPLTGIAWPWFVLIGTTITLLSGILLSLLPAAAVQQDSSPHD